MKNFRIKNSKEGFTSTEQQYESFVKNFSFTPGALLGS